MTITAEQPTPSITEPEGLISPDLFRRLVDRIVHEQHLSGKDAERLLSQTLAFLKACALNPGAGLAPSRTVDVGWHTFVLYTREYAEFCHRVAGRFIHHTPNDNHTSDGTADGEAASIGTTVEAMRAASLPVDIDLWASAGDCSQCHQGCHDSPRTV
ncbi:glycine-rich domain-containing protein [Actinomadura sp. 1N219]|uniref:glycine-rich domain-containing protein n=1 Tax=Actinomadura sp. 1N219 TaxID=3375152 RepID=UPI00378D428C